MRDNETSFNRKRIRVGDFVEDCRYHPCRVTEVDGNKRWNTSVRAVSLITGTEINCDVLACGVKKLRPSRVKAMLSVYKRDGERGLMLLCGAAPAFVRKWMERGTRAN